MSLTLTQHKYMQYCAVGTSMINVLRMVTKLNERKYF